MAVGVLGLGSLVGGGRLYAAKHHQRETNKFFQSLLTTSEYNLAFRSVLPRDPMTVGVGRDPMKKLNMLRDVDTSVALVGDYRSGKTIFLSNTILSDLGPWWYRYVFPPRGLFLSADYEPSTMDAWLKNQIVTTGMDDPWSAVADILSQRRREQRVRLFLGQVFKNRLPSFLLPQPAIIVVNQAEEMLRAQRANFLVAFEDLAKKSRDTDLVRLVLVINTENAVKALELMGGGMFNVIRAPKVSREAVIEHYGDEFAKVFDDCDSCIGIALDYFEDTSSKKMTAKEYATMRKEMYASDHCLTVEITREEYIKARDRFKKQNPVH